MTFRLNLMVAPDALPHAPMVGGGQCGPLSTAAEGDSTHGSLLSEPDLTLQRNIDGQEPAPNDAMANNASSSSALVGVLG